MKLRVVVQDEDGVTVFAGPLFMVDPRTGPGDTAHHVVCGMRQSMRGLVEPECFDGQVEAVSEVLYPMDPDEV